MSNASHSPKISDLHGPVFDAIPDMFVLYDKDHTILDILHPKPELMSDRPEAFIGKSMTEERLKQVVGANYHQLEAVISTQKPSRFVFRHKGYRSGKILYYEVYLSWLEAGYVLADIRTVHEKSVALMESEHLHYFFTEVLENLAIPVSVKSMDTERYVYWSKKAEQFGRTAEEMIDGTEELFMPKNKAFQAQQIDRDMLQGKEKQYQGVEKYTLRDGKKHTFVVTRTLFSFGDEKLILNSALDISELKETQSSLLHTKDELARKNMSLSSALSLAKVIPWGCDVERDVFYCDYDAYHPDHAPEPDGHGCYVVPMERYFAGVHPDYRQEAIRMIAELKEGKRTEFHETYMVHWFNEREWEWVQVQCSVSRRSVGGKPVSLIGSAQRITEQKETELALLKAKEELNVKNATLSSVLGIAHVIPWSGDLKTGVFSCDYNDYHHEEATEPDAKGEYALTFDRFFSRIHPDYREHAIEQFADLIAGRISEFHEVYPIHWYNDHEYEWLETQSSIPKYEINGDLRQLIGSARVITAQKQMEESLRIAKEEAERSNTLKSAFLANMSHEIRTPLNAIVGFSELLADAQDEEEKKEYLNIIKNSNALLLQLVGDILDLSKIEAGTLEFSFADHDLSEIMEELERTARMKISDPAIEVACKERMPGCTIHTDRGRLSQVMHNFINNAAKFTGQGHIHFGYRKLPDDRWYFYVEDTGCGIPSDKIDNIFGRFVKLDAKAKGTGLGLAISKSIIERLGGEIGVTSVNGEGSTFWFRLPAGCVTTSGSAAEAIESPPESPCPDTGQPTLLIAEDDPANYKLFEVMLKKHYTLLHAWNGREAVEIFRANRPCMILMDIKMPEMDGYEATAAIRELSSDIPIVAVTAFAYPEDMRRILSSGFNGCLPKPVSAESLKKKISELCPGK
ncbi:response regulator [Alistipes indistinctus]|jgi:PAS domain S-box-containing protein|uniref:ATP-binding protein n=1 Tax=Alistipes indistinctus TaxID=626932 RepID=UPI000E4BCBE1|nr:ATP-binding protein [Alistipes indistinctus]RGU38363.1 response regulator [Alistipes indistinctus]